MAYLVEYEGLSLICFECGRYGHRKESCQWSYVQKKQEVPGQEQMLQTSKASPPNMQISAKIQQQLNPSSEERFGPWMLVGHGNRNKVGRKPAHMVGGGERTTALRNSRKSEKMPANSRFTVLAQMEEEEPLGMVADRRRKAWVPVKSSSDYGTSSDRAESQRTPNGEGGSTDRLREGSEPLEVKGSMEVCAGEDGLLVGQGEDVACAGDGIDLVGQGVGGRNESKGVSGERKAQKGFKVQERENGGQSKSGVGRVVSGPAVNKGREREVQHKKNLIGAKSAGSRAAVMGQRSHIIVGGNINQMESKPILNNNTTEGPKINGMLLLEGPESIEDQTPDAFLKEKFEQSIDHNLEFVTDLEEDVGDDFNFMDVQDQGDYDLSVQEAQGQDDPMIG